MRVPSSQVKENKMKNVCIAAVVAVSCFVFADDVDNFENNTWSHWSSSKAAVSYERAVNKGLKNSGALRLVMLKDNPAKMGGLFLKRYKVNTDKWYWVEVYMKQDGNQKGVTASLSAIAVSEAKSDLNAAKTVMVTADSEWKKMSCLLNVPQKTAYVEIFLSASNGQDTAVLFDDFKLSEVDISKGLKEEFDYNLWNFWKGTGMEAEVFHTIFEGNTKKGAIGVNVAAPQGTRNTSGCFTYTLPVTPGEEYTFTVFAKSKGLPADATVSLGIQAKDADGKFLGLQDKSAKITAEACSEQWKRIALTFRIPQTGKWVKCTNMLVTLGIRSSQPVTVFFDDFEYFNTKDE